MKNIQLFVPKFRKEEIFEEMSSCLDTGWTGQGNKTLEIEEEWKKYTGLKNAHFINSNTSGLHLAIKVLKDVNKWKDGDEIITTPLTFVSSNHAILYNNLKPVFADVDETLCLDPSSIEERITKKTRAVLFVGMGGNTGQLNRVIELCRHRKLKLILDAAHMAGTFMKMGFGVGYYAAHAGVDIDVAVFSFQAVKNLPTADSGMICFENSDYDALARKLSWLGIDKDTYSRTLSKGNYKWEYDIVDVGYKYNGNSIMAAMALVGLRHLEEDNTIRRQICDTYSKAFKLENIDSIPIHPHCYKPSRHLYQIRIPQRDEAITYLNNRGIHPGVHYRDNTEYSMYSYAQGTCPHAHSLSKQLISLPLHLNLSDEDVEYIIKEVIDVNKILQE